MLQRVLNMFRVADLRGLADTSFPTPRIVATFGALAVPGGSF